MTTAANTIADENRVSAAAFDGRSVGTFDGHDRLIAAKAIVRGATSKLALPWALGMILVGMVTLAACVLIPIREENRQLAHQSGSLRAEADFVQQQAEANAEFVARIHNDPALAERMSMRMTRRPSAGKKFLDAEQATAFSSSPYALTRLAAPPARPEYRSDLPPAVVGLFNDTSSRAVLIGASVFLIAAAVVLGKSAAREVPNAE